MNEQEFRKSMEEIKTLRGQIGAREIPQTQTYQSLDDSSSPPQREPAKIRLARQIESLRRGAKEQHQTAVQFQALYNELPEILSPQADNALHELLGMIPKRY